MSNTKSSTKTTSAPASSTTVPTDEVEKIVVLRLYVPQGDTRALAEVESKARTALSNAFADECIVATVDKRYLVRGAVVREAEYDPVSGTITRYVAPAAKDPAHLQTVDEYLKARNKIDGRTPKEALDDLRRNSPVRKEQDRAPVRTQVWSGPGRGSAAVDEVEDIDVDEIEDLDLTNLDLDAIAADTAKASVKRVKKGGK